MSAPTVVAPATSRRPRPWIGIVLVAVLLAATCAYVRVGWWRMEAACGPDDASESVVHAWSRAGFTCTYDSGSVVSSWWF